MYTLLVKINENGGVQINHEEKESNLVFYAQSTSRLYQGESMTTSVLLVQELCESRGGRPGLSILTSLMVSVDVKLY